jgi:voltage-gated sodium channel
VARAVRRVAENPVFQNVVLAVILVNAVVVGLETDPALAERYHGLFGPLEMVIQTIFVIEIAIRLLAHWPRMMGFFRDGWNVFDLAVVLASLLPQAGAFATVARLARLLRVTRLVSVFPELRLIITTMLKSIPSMGHVLMMLSLLLYVYAVVGVYLFREHDPARWGGLASAFLTLFQLLTVEGWVEVQTAVLDDLPFAWLYFMSFIFVAVFVVVNLFIAVVINNLETAKLEEQLADDRRSPHHGALEGLEDIRRRLDDVERLLRARGPVPPGA